MVGIIFCFYSGINRRYCRALGMAYPDSSFSVHCLCKGHGHYVTR